MPTHTRQPKGRGKAWCGHAALNSGKSVPKAKRPSAAAAAAAALTHSASLPGETLMTLHKVESTLPHSQATPL